MAACKHCGGTFAAADLVRHERGRTLVVHCPDCAAPMGRYRRHGQRSRDG